MRDKLIEIISSECADVLISCADKCDNCPSENCIGCLADRLIDHGVTMQTTPISYERLLKLAKKMHTWIFLHCADEEKVYDELGITEEENYVFGYGGKIEMRISEAPKEEG